MARRTHPLKFSSKQHTCVFLLGGDSTVGVYVLLVFRKLRAVFVKEPGDLFKGSHLDGS